MNALKSVARTQRVNQLTECGTEPDWLWISLDSFFNFISPILEVDIHFLVGVTIPRKRPKKTRNPEKDPKKTLFSTKLCLYVDMLL